MNIGKTFTFQEQRVIKLTLLGCSSPVIISALSVKAETYWKHRKNILRKARIIDPNIEKFDDLFKTTIALKDEFKPYMR